MDKKTKKEWLKALRSGEYKQGDGALRKEDDDCGGEKFCCLGVLCDLIEPNQWRQVNGEWRNGSASQDGGMPREGLQDKLGLSRKINRSGVTNQTIAEKLAAMNDNGRTFKQIADWLEKRDF